MENRKLLTDKMIPLATVVAHVSLLSRPLIYRSVALQGIYQLSNTHVQVGDWNNGRFVVSANSRGTSNTQMQGVSM